MILKITNSIVRVRIRVNTPCVQKPERTKNRLNLEGVLNRKNTTIAVVQLLNDSSLDSDSLWIDFSPAIT